MQKDYRVYLEDMLEAARKILSATSDVSFQRFSEDWLIRDAVMHNFVVLGAAARRLPDEYHARFPGVPWRRIIGLRNRVVHEYNSLAGETLWDIIQTDVAQLTTTISVILAELQDGD